MIPYITYEDDNMPVHRPVSECLRNMDYEELEWFAKALKDAGYFHCVRLF